MIDLHIHTTYSDGTLSPAEILSLAEKKGITTISLSDHNNIGAYQDLKDPSVRSLFSGRIITGCEFNTIIYGESVEILGYGFDLAPIGVFFEQRKKIFPDIMQAELELLYSTYLSKGVRLELPISEFSREKYIGPKRFIFHQLQSEQNRKFFLDPENQTSPQTFYRRELYNLKSPLYVDYSPLHPTPQQLVDLIHGAGGVAFLAHCYLYTPSITTRLSQLTRAIGLDGIECHYATFTPAQTDALVKLCNQQNLLISGGSDFHGELPLRPQVELGSVTIPPEHIDWTKTCHTC